MRLGEWRSEPFRIGDLPCLGSHTVSSLPLVEVVEAILNRLMYHVALVADKRRLLGACLDTSIRFCPERRETSPGRFDAPSTDLACQGLAASSERAVVLCSAGEVTAACRADLTPASVLCEVSYRWAPARQPGQATPTRMPLRESC